MVTSSQKLIGISEIAISSGKTPRKRENYFQSESIEFNSHFKVRFLKQFEVYKLFPPKIIDNFISTEPNFLKKDTIVLANQKAHITRRDSREALNSWVPDAYDYSKIRWNEKRMFQDIFKKIALVFNRYYEIQALLQPLELY